MKRWIFRRVEGSSKKEGHHRQKCGGGGVSRRVFTFSQTHVQEDPRMIAFEVPGC